MEGERNGIDPQRRLPGMGQKKENYVAKTGGDSALRKK